MDHKPATIKEIAQRLSVSISTVSRALHNHPSIGLRTRMQVKKLAAEMNYEPNQAAISFKKGRTFTIGVILPNLREEFFSMAINGIEDVATKNNYTVLIGQSHDDKEREKKIVDSMRRYRVDGIIVSISKNTDSFEHFAELEKQKIHVVFFDRVPESDNVYRVFCSLKQSSVEMVDWLIKHGHKRIGFIKGPESMTSTDERLQGYLQSLAKNGIKVDRDLITETDLTREHNVAAIKKLITINQNVTAVVTFNDYVAFDAIRYARDTGHDNISFASYGNIPMISYLDHPPVVSIEQFPQQQAEKATEILLKLIEAKDIPIHMLNKIVLEGKLSIHHDK